MRFIALLPLLLAACGETECLVQDSQATTPECDGQDGCCGFTWGACADGTNYEVRCDGRAQPVQCDCYEDGAFTQSFEPNGFQCPANFEQPRIESILDAANEGCGWKIAP
ncbi:MAG: hypothetical protein ACJAZO_004795 [Myxococcota bacterium]|jgi:hypothetical protein